MTIIIPEWIVYLLAVYMALSTINILLDFYLSYLRGKIKKLMGNDGKENFKNYL